MGNIISHFIAARSMPKNNELGSPKASTCDPGGGPYHAFTQYVTSWGECVASTVQTQDIKSVLYNYSQNFGL